MNTQVSVLMSVFNNPVQVQHTIDSVLAQQNIELQFIIVDDGADEKVKEVLKQYIDNPTVTLVTQNNQGLTKALIVGCQNAKHALIARIDAGDIMCEARLQKQATVLNENPQLSMVTSWVDVVTEEGLPLFEVRHTNGQLNAGLTATDIDELVSPAHFSVMFRATNYHEVGGYRPEFYYAQDVDLWLRMINTGEIHVIEEVLTQAIFSAQGISGQNAPQQQALAKLALKNLRENDIESLRLAERIRPQVSPNPKIVKSDNVASLYFMARCLHKQNPTAAMSYYKRILSQSPWHIKAILGYLQTCASVFK